VYVDVLGGSFWLSAQMGLGLVGLRLGLVLGLVWVGLGPLVTLSV